MSPHKDREKNSDQGGIQKARSDLVAQPVEQRLSKSEGRGLVSHPGQSFSLSLSGPISLRRANAQMG